MKTVEKWQWRIQWAGRWTTTHIARTEEDIRREHPEAIRIEGTRVAAELPDTEAEIDAIHRRSKPGEP